MGPFGDQGVSGSLRWTRRASTQLFQRELAEGRPNLIELKALEALELYGFPTVPYKLATTADEAVAAAEEMGYPGGDEDLRPQDPAQDGCRRREVEPGR